MDQTLADRIRALPAAVLAKLATVEGPGWGIHSPTDIQTNGSPPKYWRGFVGRDGATAWWPADYPAAIAAVKGWDLSTTFEALEVHARCCPEKTGAELALDIIAYTAEVEDAAVAIVAARTAWSDTPRQTVTNLGKVGEIVNLQGPVTLSIGADGVKVTR